MAAPKKAVGPKSDKLWRDAIMRAVHRADAGIKTKRLELLADRLVQEGLAGEVSALREIGDRIDGKPTTTLDTTDKLAEAIKGIQVIFGSQE